jgi:DNA-binding LacI/PurR family transcriptional regulator
VPWSNSSSCKIGPPLWCAPNNMTAIGVIREAYDHGIKIPTDMSVVGFDDIRLARSMIPPLTTMQMSQNELAQIAFRALLKEVDRESPSTQKSEYELNTNLILRRSTAMALPSSSRPRLTRHLRLPASPAKSIGT